MHKNGSRMKRSASRCWLVSKWHHVAPGQSARPQRRLPLRGRNKFVGVSDIARADLEAVQHGKAVKRVLKPRRAEFELAGAVSDERTCGGGSKEPMPQGRDGGKDEDDGGREHC